MLDMLRDALKAMAFSRAEGLKELNAKLNPIISHLIKIAIIDEHRDIYVRHWQHEVLGWLEDINFVCNNLKKGKSLRLVDYLTCLQDDLGKESRVRAHIGRIESRWGEVPPKFKPYNITKLHKTLKSILESQFAIMAEDRWSKQSLLDDLTYRTLLV